MNKLLFFYFVCTIPFVSLWFVNRTRIDVMDETYDWSDMSAFMHPDYDVCIATGKNINFYAEVKFDESMEPLGQWDYSAHTIRLRERDIDTIAHEVNHLVKDLVRQHGITDDHYEAYAQGFWTECVWNIVERMAVVDGINRLNGTQ